MANGKCKHCGKSIGDTERWEWYYPAHERAGEKATVKIHARCVELMMQQILKLAASDKRK